ncbi:MAG: YdcH family protein [Pseudomonadota bacterium]
MLSRRDILLTRHSALERQIADELERPAPDEAALKTMKVAKLALKDEIARIDRAAWRKRRNKRAMSRRGLFGVAA